MAGLLLTVACTTTTQSTVTAPREAAVIPVEDATPEERQVDASETSSGSDAAPATNASPTTVVATTPPTDPPSTTIPSRFVLPEPYRSVDWCTSEGGSGCPLGHPKQNVYDDVYIAMQRDYLDLGYRLAPQEFPSVWDRNPDVWLALSPLERSDFLDVVLWNYIARATIQEGVQGRTAADIGADFDYVISVSEYLAEVARRDNSYIPAALQNIKDAIVIDAGQPEWFAEWLLNGAVAIGVPGVAPEMMSSIDNSIRYTSR